MRGIALLGTLLLAACGRDRDCAAEPPEPGETVRCAVGDDRSYLARVPDAEGPLPVVLVLHGGGGNAEGAAGVASPDGDPDHPDGMNALAESEGFAVVYAEGTPGKLLRKKRTWNAGGGTGDWQCVSGQACKDGVDDVAYFAALLDDLEGWLDVDTDRVYATGISNGGAMSYRLAHELPDRIAAIAPIGGADQLGVADGAVPASPVPVLHIHGTEDPCWPWEGGAEACLQEDGKDKAGVDDSLAIWAEANGCSAADPVVESLPDAAEDGTISTIETWQGCAADLALWRIEGGGHTWPDGDQYLRERTIGRVERDVKGNTRIWAFFSKYSISR